MLDSNHQWSSLKILHAHTEGILEKRIDIKDISKLGKWAFPPPCSPREIDIKEFFKVPDRRERATS